MPPMVGAFSANRSICCGTQRRADLCLLWRGMGLSPILVARRGDTLESAASDAVERLFRTSCKSAPSITSADKSVWGSTARRTLAQADRSNIHAGISSQLFASDAVRSQRKTTPLGLSIASWMPIPKPDHGCHGYSSSQNSVPWAASIISRRTSSWLEQQDQRPATQRAGALR